MGAGEPQNTLILKLATVHIEKGLYPVRPSSSYTVEAAHGRPPWPPDQPSQGLSAGSPLPQLWVVQGVTKPAFLASGISSCQRESQVESDATGTPSELEDNEYIMSEVRIRMGERRNESTLTWQESGLPWPPSALRSRQCD